MERIVRKHGESAVLSVGVKCLGFHPLWVTHRSEVVKIERALNEHSNS
jgi:hypothetical protein